MASQMVTVKVSNVSLEASEQDIKEFFSFSGDIVYVEMQSDTEQRSQIGYVTFKDSQGAETAILLTGATIVNSSVTVTLAPDYQLPPAALAAMENKPDGGGADSAFRKAEDVVTSMLAKGFILGKDAVGKAKNFDEKHQLTSTASAKVASLDQKIGLTDKITAGSAVVSDKVREVDQKFQVSEKTKSALAAAEQTVSNAGSAIMKNRYVLTGTTWVAGAFNRVTKAAEEVGQKAMEKTTDGSVQEEEKDEKKKPADESAEIHLPESPKTVQKNPSEDPLKLEVPETHEQPASKPAQP